MGVFHWTPCVSELVVLLWTRGSRHHLRSPGKLKNCFHVSGDLKIKYKHILEQHFLTE